MNEMDDNRYEINRVKYWAYVQELPKELLLEEK